MEKKSFEEPSGKEQKNSEKNENLSDFFSNAEIIFSMSDFVRYSESVLLKELPKRIPAKNVETAIAITTPTIILLNDDLLIVILSEFSGRDSKFLI